MRVYLDTSLLVAVYVPESLTRKVLQLLKEPIIVFVSSLAEVEFHSALSRKLRMGELRTSQCRRIRGLFDRHLREARYQRLTISPAAFTTAVDFLLDFSTPLRTLDALHLACSFHTETTLLTADATLSRADSHFEVPCKLLES